MAIPNLRQLFAVLTLLLAMTMLAAACGTGSQPATDPGDDAKPTIRIGLDPYQYSRVPAYLGQHVLREIGYDVRIVEADVGPLYQALARGDVDFYVDVWPDVLQVTYLERFEGEVEVIGDLYDNAPVGVGVPAYAPEGLQSIEDLNDYIDFTGGKIYALEPGSGMTQTTHKMVEEYGLQYEVVEGSEAAMLAEMRRAFSRNEGIVFLLWRPHTMFVNFDIRVLDDPQRVWGPPGSRHSIGMHAGFDREKGAEAYELFKNMELSIEELEAWMFREDEEQIDPEVQAREWVENNPDRVKAWLGDYADQWDAR